MSSHDREDDALAQESAEPSTQAVHPPRRSASDRKAYGWWVAGQLDASIRAHGFSSAQIARCLGLGETRVREYRSGDAAIPARDVMRLPTAVAADVLRALLEQVEADELRRRRDVASHGRQVTRATGALADTIDHALDDGQVSSEEAEAIRARAREVVAVAAHLVRDLPESKP